MKDFLKCVHLLATAFNCIELFSFQEQTYPMIYVYAHVCKHSDVSHVYFQVEIGFRMCIKTHECTQTHTHYTHKYTMNAFPRRNTGNNLTKDNLTPKDKTKWQLWFINLSVVWSLLVKRSRLSIFIKVVALKLSPKRQRV